MPNLGKGQILDYRGLPVKTADLKEELAAPGLGKVRNSWWPGVYDITPERLGEILTAVDVNNHYMYMTLAEQMEEQEWHYASVIRTRKLAVTKLELTVEAFSEKQADEDIAEDVRKLFKGPRRAVLRRLMDGISKAYSVCEIMWEFSEKQWSISDFIWRDPRFFIYDWATGWELRLRDEIDPALGIELKPFKFAVHQPELKTGLPLRGGLARLASVAYMCKSFDIKSWLTFAEVYGMPVRVGKYPQAATLDQQAKLLRSVSMIGTDACCIIPDTMNLEFIAAQSAGDGSKLFQGMADWFDAQVSKAVLGQTSATDAKSLGLGSNQAKVHDDLREDIRDDDAMQLCVTLQRDVINPYCKLNYGLEPDECPQINIAVKKEEDLVQWGAAILPFVEQGLRVEESVAREKFGLSEPAEGAILLQPKAAIAAQFMQQPSDGSADDARAGSRGGPTSSKGKPAVGGKPQPRAPQRLKPANNEPPPKTQQQPKNFSKGLLRGSLMALAHVGSSEDDEIDRMVAANLRSAGPEILEPLLDEIVKLAQTCDSKDEFERKLDKVVGNANMGHFANRLATATFQARALGDATDKV